MISYICYVDLLSFDDIFFGEEIFSWLPSKKEGQTTYKYDTYYTYFFKVHRCCARMLIEVKAIIYKKMQRNYKKLFTQRQGYVGSKFETKVVDFNSLFDENGDIEDGSNQKAVDQQEDEGLAADEAEEDEVIFNEVSILSICPII